MACMTIVFANKSAARRFARAMAVRGYFGDTFIGDDAKPVWFNESRESIEAAQNTIAEDMKRGDILTRVII